MARVVKTKAQMLREEEEAARAKRRKKAAKKPAVKVKKKEEIEFVDEEVELPVKEPTREDFAPPRSEQRQSEEPVVVPPVRANPNPSRRDWAEPRADWQALVVSSEEPSEIVSSEEGEEFSHSRDVPEESPAAKAMAKASAREDSF